MPHRKVRKYPTKIRLGEGISSEMERWQCPDIEMGYAITRFTNEGIFSRRNADDVVRIHLGLRGNYHFDFIPLGQSFDLIGGHVNILYSPSFEICVSNKTEVIETFGIQISRKRFLGFTQGASDFLKNFTNQILENQSTILSPVWGPVTVELERIITELKSTRYQDGLQELFLLSKAIEVLVLVVDSCDRSHENKLFIKKKADKEKILAARDLINENYIRPLSLSKIAREVELNEYKLKKGFKEIFGHTVFGYLREMRLNYSLQLLRNTDMTATEIGHRLGYSTPQHFHRQFKRKFGCTPSKARKNP